MDKIQSNLIKFSEKYLVVIFLAITIVISAIYYFSNNQILIYFDATSHLNIARRVVDNLTPGFIQIGSVWLPLMHSLFVLFVWNDFLYRTGLAGTIISGLAYVGTGIFLYALLGNLVKSRIARILGLLIFAFNPNVLYLSTIPMDEILMLFFLAGSSYYYYKWIKFRQFHDLISSSFLILFGSLVRYELWAVVAAQAIGVLMITYIKNRSLKEIEGLAILFSTVAFFGIFLWLIWNYAIWGNALYFMNGPYSAFAQQQSFAKYNTLLTQHNLFHSIAVYASAIYENIGIVTFLGTLISGFYVFLSKRDLSSKVFLLILLAPIVMVIYTLFKGITVIFTNQYSYLDLGILFNVRYGINAILISSVFIAIFADRLFSFKKRILKIPLVLILLLLITSQVYLFQKEKVPVTLQDGLTGISAVGSNEEISADLMSKYYTNGLILASTGSRMDTVLFHSGIPLKNFITEGTGKYWKTSINNPTEFADYILLSSFDPISEEASKNKNYLKDYQLLFTHDNISFYEKKTKYATEKRSVVLNESPVEQ